jgi:hypothetical protein
MKKLLVVLVFLAAVPAAAYVLMSGDAVQTKHEIAGPSNSDLYTAIQEALRTHESGVGERLALLVPGEKVDLTSWNFRATVNSGDLSKPAFGTIRNLCDAFAETRCWELVSLEIDGQEAFAEAAQETGPSLDQSARLQLQDATPNEQDTPLEKEGGTALQPASAPNLPPTPETWHTRTDNVNGRVGPGTDYDVAFKMPMVLELTLIETRDGWGRFAYPASDGTAGEIWIWMQLVEKR